MKEKVSKIKQGLKLTVKGIQKCVQVLVLVQSVLLAATAALNDFLEQK